METHTHDTQEQNTIRVSPLAYHAHLSEFSFDPQPDITTWELAQCMALIQQTNLVGDLTESLIEKGIARHFVRLTY